MSDVKLVGYDFAIHTSPVDYTTAYITDEYKKHMDTLYRVFNKNTPLTEEDVADVQAAMQALNKLAIEGDSKSDPTRTMYMMPGMISSINTISLALSARGMTPPAFKGTVQDLTEVKARPVGKDADGNPVSMAAYISMVTASETTSATKTLVSMIETEFIPETFKMFAQILGGLQEGMHLTEEIMSILNQIMQISNMSDAGLPSGFKPLPENSSEIPPECINDLVDYMNKTKGGSGDAFRKAYDADVAWAKAESAKNPQKYPTPEDALKTRTDGSSKLKSFLLEEDVKEKDRNGSRMNYVMDKIYSKHFSEYNRTATPTENAGMELLELKKRLEVLIGQLDAPSTAPPNLSYYLGLVVKDIDSAFEGIHTTGKSTTQIKELYNNAASNWILNKEKNANLNRGIEMSKNTNDKQNAKFKEEYEKFVEFVKLATMLLEGIYKAFSAFAKGIG